MRIIDWSSYVCSSDLEGQDRGKEGAVTHAHCERWPLHRAIKARLVLVLEPGHDPSFLLFDRLRQPDRQHGRHEGQREDEGEDECHNDRQRHRREGLAFDASERRSEEHTSELKSLMRISYAVFCLKKNTNENDIDQ